MHYGKNFEVLIVVAQTNKLALCKADQSWIYTNCMAKLCWQMQYAEQIPDTTVSNFLYSRITLQYFLPRQVTTVKATDYSYETQEF